jgi:hypothetical protein
MNAAAKMERMRRGWFESVDTRPQLLEKALAKLEEKLEAKETKFFAHQGIVVTEQEVEAHSIQLEAAQTIAKLADAFPKERADSKGAPQFALEIKDGVFRLVIGGEGGSSREEVAYGLATNKQLNEESSAGGQLVPVAANPRDSEQPPLFHDHTTMPQAQDQPTTEYVSKEDALRTLRGEA